MPFPQISESHLVSAQRVANDLSSRFSIAGLYITGSLAAGLGNATSDLDIVAVTDDGNETAEWSSDDGLVTHVEIFSREMVEGWLSQLASLPHRHADYSAALKTELLLENLSRLYYAIPVVGRELVADWQRQLDTAALRQGYMLYHATDAITYARDALGAVQSGDLLTGWDVSQQALRGVLLMALAATDDLYYGKKWLLKRIATCPAFGSDLAEHAFALLYPEGGLPRQDESLMTQTIMDRMRCAAFLSAFACVFGWEKPLAQPPGLPPPENGERSVWYVYARFRDTCFAGGPQGWRLSRIDVLAWLLLRPGQSAEDLAGSLSAQVGAHVSERFSAGVLDRLHTAGLAGPRRIRAGQTAEWQANGG